ncbi:MAG: PQQ-dependent sugar dehydrogenase [Flavobacteriales bacterium]|nr:PQQ-dependent sugar dehydrogenase [Flavobacteriales bacterium]
MTGPTDGAQAQIVPPNFADALVMGGWNEPVGATWDANGRMYVWEKRGMVWIVDGGVKLPNPLVNISEEVGNWRDHGLLGFALDPNFLANGRVYLLYLVDRHHLKFHGTPNYNPNTNHYYQASVMRITRYTANGPSFNSVDPASRFVLVGATPQTGAPNLHESHSTGSIVFGADGTLMAAFGDGASYASTDLGNAGETYVDSALADGIIRPQENVGAFRSQMVNCLNGKVIRIDPVTGHGIPSNPWYDPAEPNATRSKVWALGLRNPFRMTIDRSQGSNDPSAGRPGTLYIGDVGWNVWEDLNVCYEGGMNFGWPLYEGMTQHNNYMGASIMNLDAPNPLYDGVSCTQSHFMFKDLLKQDTPIHLNGHPNPCNPSVQIPNSIPKFFHARPAIDWRHGNQSRCAGFLGSTAVTWDLDAADSPVPGPRFGGNAAIGGPKMAGQNFPLGYQNSSFHGDYPGGWIRRFVFDAQDKPVSVHNFATNLGAIVWIGEGPDGCLWYIKYNNSELRRICYTLAVNLPPVAVATQNEQYGPGPLTVQFSSAGSLDPENGPITFHWDFGDGQQSTAPNPQHTYTAPPGVPTTYQVVLTVKDDQNQQATANLIVSLNNTPPQVEIISFENGSTYPLGVDTVYQLVANVTDLEHGPAQLSYAWRTTLHHNTHMHPEAIDNNPVTSTMISGVGCDGESYSYNITLTVTDAGGLATTVDHWLFPRCSAIAPTAVILTNTNAGPGPLQVQFDGTNSYDPGYIAAYHWDFNDGTFSTDPAPLKVFTESGDHVVVLTVTDDDGLTDQATRVITVVTPGPAECVGALGSLLAQRWTGIGGTNVSDLLNHPNYPNNPNTTFYPTSFQGQVNIADNYGTRVRGYIIPPTTGLYTFTVTSDDASVVYLSPGPDPQYKQQICSVPGWTNETEYFKYPSQVSAPVMLQAGAYYYVEMIHKEGSGGDHWALRWQTPTNSNRVIIPGSALGRWQDCGPGVKLRAALQGPWDPSVNLMKDGMRQQGLVPLAEPYAALGFGNAGGETTTPQRLAVSGKNAVVDWVLVEIRNKNTPTTVLARKSCLLERDGDVVDVQGKSRLEFGLPQGEYLVSIRHRNHMGAMAQWPVMLSPQAGFVDLTMPSTATWGQQARAPLNGGRMGLWSGHVVRNGKVKYTGQDNDRDPILVRIGGVVPSNTAAGYHVEDVNLDGLVKYTGAGNDRDPILVNIGGTVPTSIREEQLP